MFLKRLLRVIFVLLMVISCGQKQDCLQNGDLIFVGLPTGYATDSGSMDAAISSATGEVGALNLTHVAIAEVNADSIWIIDATVSRGVDRHPLDTFLRDFTLPDGSYPEFIVKRVKGIDADAAVERAKSFCDRAYDLRFLPENEDLYCSELVQKSYLDFNGKPVFKSEPMNFMAPDGTVPPYWKESFEGLGMDIPQGVPGTNPQKMSQAECLVTVRTNVSRRDFLVGMSGEMRIFRPINLIFAIVNFICQ